MSLLFFLCNELNRCAKVKEKVRGDEAVVRASKLFDVLAMFQTPTKELRPLFDMHILRRFYVESTCNLLWRRVRRGGGWGSLQWLYSWI